MKVSKLFFVLFLIIVVASCKKKTDSGTVMNSAPCVLQEYFWNGSPNGIGTVKLAFNSQRYPMRADFSGSSFSDGSFSTYHYLNDSLIDTITVHFVSTHQGSFIQDNVVVYEYLPNGKFNSVKQISLDVNGNVTSTSIGTFSYSNASNVTIDFSPSSTRTIYQYNTLGDIDRYQFYDTIGHLYFESFFTYDGNPNGFGMLARYQNFSSAFHYNTSVHNITQAISIRYDSLNNDTSVVRYSYNYNSNGFPILQTVLASDTVMHTLEYSCNE